MEKGEDKRTRRHYAGKGKPKALGPTVVCSYDQFSVHDLGRIHFRDYDATTEVGGLSP